MIINMLIYKIQCALIWTIAKNRLLNVKEKKDAKIDINL